MGIYILLLVLVILAAFFISATSMTVSKKRTIFLLIAFGAIFLLYSLRASSVGRDLPGYESAYILTGTKDWSDFSYIYYEEGYIFLMKLCHFMGMDFQGFLTVVNAIILIPIYIFIKKYSRYPFLSVLIYICYMFFEFNLTGIRQAIATSIVLTGIILLIEKKRSGIIYYTVMIYLATLFHTGAFIGYFYIPFHFMKKRKYYLSFTIGMSILFFLARGQMLTLIKLIFGKDSMNASAGLYIGFNFLYTVGLAVVFVMANDWHMKKIGRMTEGKKDDRSGRLSERLTYEVSRYDINTRLLKLFLLSVCALILFGSDTSARSYMILNQVVIVLLPNSIEYLFTKESQKWAVLGITAFMILFFFKNTLIGGGFDIVPYKFYWQ